MKNQIFTLLFVVTSIVTLAQTAAINPTKITVGQTSTGLPSDGEYNNIPLNIWQSNTAYANFPALRISDNYGKFTMAIPTCDGCWSAMAKRGDMVFRLNGGSNLINPNVNMIFDIGGSYPTTNNQVIFANGWNKALSITNYGKVGIGVSTLPNDANYNLFVKNGIKTERLKIELCNAGGWCDYVFDSTYKLASLDSVACQIQANKHLPNMPSASQLVQEEGFEIGDMTKMHQEKIEELFLYIIEINKKMQALQAQTQTLQAENEILKQSVIGNK